MKAPCTAILLRIYTDEQALFGSGSLIDEILRRAREAKLAGATVLRGQIGFGESVHIHQHRPFDLNQDLPVVVEIVDYEPSLRNFVGRLDDLTEIGLVTFEKVEVVRYGGHHPRNHG